MIPLPAPLPVRRRWLVHALGLLALALLALGAIAAGWWLGRPKPLSIPPRTLAVAVVNVGHGEAAWIKTPEGRFLVVGAGPPGAEGRIAASLQAAGATEIDLLILPYPYAEALGGAAGLAERFPVREALDNGWFRLNAHHEAVQKALKARGIPVHVARAGQTRTLGGVRLEILAPAEPLIARAPTAANNSIVLRLVWGKTAFLFLGGCERDGEAALLTRLPGLEADWLRVARFATGEATSPELLRTVAPQFAVVSVGANRSGYPSPETIKRLEASGAKVFRTDTASRDLLFFSDGQRVMLAP